MKVIISVRFDRLTMPAVPDALMGRVNVAVSEALRELAASSSS